MTERACPHVEQTHAFADGELTGADAVRVRDHLATCEVCQAELAEVLQLDAAVATHRGQVISLAWYRRRRLQLAGVALAVAAGLAVYVARPRPAVAPDVAVALAPRRALEARLAWGDAAAYRSYDVPRAGEAPHESIAMRSLAELEARGDVHGLGALALLTGERRRAADYLERAGDSADVRSDRAAVALADHQPERALAFADAALVAQPDHRPALWNRALALRDLGLPRTAAAAFREVGSRGEPGWASEARKYAAALDAETDAIEHCFDRINQAGVALARGEVALSADDARAMPGFARGILYDAIRSATTPAQLARLQPLAEAIDSADRDTAMHDALVRAGAALHPSLSKQYGEMIRALAVEMQVAPARGDEPPVPAGAARRKLLASLRAAHADDLLIGVLMKTSDDRWNLNREEIAEFAALTAASPDPWMQLLGLEEQAKLALAADDLVSAEAILLRAKQRCTAPGAPALRCVLIGRLLGRLYLQWQRLPEARAVLSVAWQTARVSGEWFVQDELLEPLAKLASLGDEAEASGLPLVRAYSDELVLRYPESLPDGRCLRAEWGRNLRAMLLVDQLRFAEARRALAGPACKGPQEPERAANNLFVRAELAQGAADDEVAQLRKEIAALRASPGTRPPEQVWLDHSEGRLLIDRDPAAGEALLRRAIAEARAIPPSVTRAHKAAAWSYSVLIVAAARRRNGAAALSLLAEEQGLALPERCVVGFAIEDQWRAVVARDATGVVRVHADDGRKTPAIDEGSASAESSPAGSAGEGARPLGNGMATRVPADIAGALASCPVVDVIARPPVHGTSRLLPVATAWRYLSRRSGPPAPSTDRALVIADVEPPAALELPRLQAWSASGEQLSGPAATPSKVLSAIATAGEVIIHAHGIVDVAQPDASFLALSAEAAGRFALTTGDVRKARFATSPLIILAACRASRAAPIWHDTWSLPAAFVYAGARAVIASAAPIPDAEAGEFFDAVRAQVRTGAPVAIALRDVRQRWLEQRRGEWVRDVIVFE